MKNSILFVFLVASLNVMAAEPLGVETFKNILHPNKGCPINSMCSKANGKIMQLWDKIFIHERANKRYKLMSTFEKKHGLPLQFLTTEDAKKEHDPILWNSRCKHHNPKNPHNNVYQGMKFIKKIPLEGELIFDSIVLFDKKKKNIYKVPYQDRPHFIKGDRLFILKDYDDSFFQISTDSKGGFRLENMNLNVFKKADSKKIKEVPCPENKEEKPDLYTSSYCQKIWDIDTNEMKTIQVFWSCP